MSTFHSFIRIMVFMTALAWVAPVKAQTNAVPDNIELAVLKNIYDSLGGSGWTTKTNWPTPGNWPATATSAQFGTWQGIVVVNGDIQMVNLPSNNLTGLLPKTIAQLTRLKFLYMGTNQISGTIPHYTGLSQLQHLYLSSNLLTGSIPAELGSLAGLMRLKLDNNGLTGSIPSELGNLTLLTDLFLNNNQLSGSVPSSLGSLSNLVYLYVRNNQLTGSLPSSLGGLTALQYFFASNNQLTGPVPTTLSGLTQLLIFDISLNQLSGPLPDVSGWTNVVQITVANNQLSGPIPSGINACTALTILKADLNAFTSLPSSLLSLPVLTTLNFENNDVNSIPDFSTQVNKANLVLNVRNNRLDFSQLEMIVGKGIKTLTYNGQRQLNDVSLVNVPIGGTLFIQGRSPGANGSINWSSRPTGTSSWVDINSLNEDTTLKTFKKSGMQLTDKGEIRYRLTNSVITGLTIESVPIKFNTGYDIVWRDLTGISVNGNTITKTASNGWGSGGAASVNELAASTDGWIEFIYDQSTCEVAFGFSDANPDAAANSIDYGVIVNGTQHQIVQNGTVAATYTSAQGDVLRIERIGTTMKFYRNSNLEHTLTGVSTGLLIADAAINGTGCKIYNGRCSFWIPAAQGQVPDIWETAVLKDLYDSLAGPSWTSKTNWPTAGNWAERYTAAQMDTWRGIVVANGDITALSLLQNNLTGRIPASISKLSKLAAIDFRVNKLSGSLPSTLTSITSLKELKLHDNLLTGTIPNDIGNLTNLEYLALSKNNFTGQVPESIGDLTKLYWLSIYLNTNLTGALPSTIYNLVNLTDLYIFDTQISGTLSEQIGNFTKLKIFYGYRNNWSGPLPSALGNISTLEDLYLYSNNFTGEIPENWRHLTNIKNLWLHYSQVSGEIPAWLGELTKMVVLSIGDTHLTGVIPPSLSNLTNMTGLYLQNLAIGGGIPDELQSLNKLTLVSLNLTNLEGPIPSWLMNKPTLKEFYLNDSKFTSLPDFSARTDKASLIINVQNNLIPAADIERYFTGANTHPFNTFLYGPQKIASLDTVIHAPLNNVLRIVAPSGGSHGVYLWERKIDDVWTDVTSQNQSTEPDIFEIQNVTADWNGTYRYTVTNAWLPDVHYESGPLDVIITDALVTEIKPLYNGIISAVRWRTTAAYGTGDEDLEGMYAFTYDDKYQVKNASWAENINYTTGAFEWAGNKFRLAGMEYDPNGNILALHRYNEDALRIHNFAYTYEANKNRLTSVSGHVNSYAYNDLGQMTGEDKETGDDQYVDYDVTGKVTKVYSDIERTVPKVEYLYDDTGFRLAKVDYQTNRTTWYIRDASGNVMSIYEQEGLPNENNENSLTEVEVPLYGSGKLGTYYPAQDGSTAYELTDHLGNVRALMRENVTTYTATMEDNEQVELTNPAVQEVNYFQNITETAFDDPHMNHTSETATVVTNPSKSAYLFWDGTPGKEASDKAIGPAIALKVNPGDTIHAEAFVRYQEETSYSRTGFTLSLLSALMGNSFNAIKGFEGSTLTETTQAFNTALTAGGFLTDSDDTRPYAYLNYIVFDGARNYVASNWVRVTEAGGFEPAARGLDGPHGRVALETPLVIPASGQYIYVWVSNESENTEVWFDDVRVTHVTTFVSQATDYGVWGDLLREQKTDESVYRFGYQGQFAEKDEETGWNHFELREYDPVIGRWTAVDPKRIGWSPYIGMFNNPVSGTDPDGGGPGDDMEFEYAQAMQQMEMNLYDEIRMTSSLLPGISVDPSFGNSWIFEHKQLGVATGDIEESGGNTLATLFNVWYEMKLTLGIYEKAVTNSDLQSFDYESHIMLSANSFNTAGGMLKTKPWVKAQLFVDGEAVTSITTLVHGPGRFVVSSDARYQYVGEVDWVIPKAGTIEIRWEGSWMVGDDPKQTPALGNVLNPKRIGFSGSYIAR